MLRLICKEVVAVEITDERVVDGRMLERLVEGAWMNRGRKPSKVMGDGAYDSRKNFNYLSGRGIEPVIKPRRNSSTRSRGSPARAKVVREIKRDGYDSWRKKHGQRWQVESVFSRFKRRGTR